MKKFKLIVPSFLTLIFCLLLIAGSTFAIFSSQDEASIAVKSGKVEVSATITELAAFSAEASDTVLATDLNYAGEATAFGVNSKYKYVNAIQLTDGYKFTNGGTAKLTNTKALSLDKLTPGDKVTAKIALVNSSNVDIKYRAKVNLVSGLKLFEALQIKLNGVLLQGVSKIGTWTYLSAPTEFDENGNPIDNMADITFELVLPIDAGNVYQNLSTKVNFTVEAVQGNAKTEDETLNTNIEVTKTVEETENTVLEDEAGLVKATVPAEAFKDNVDNITLSVKPTDSEYNIVTTSETAAQAYDVKVLIESTQNSAIKVDNVSAIQVNMFIGKNLKGVKLYHNGVEMASTAWSYDSEAGIISFVTNSFSEYAVTYNKDLVVETSVGEFTVYEATEEQGVYEVSEDVDVSQFYGVSAYKSDEATKVMSLEAFRDSVNGGNSYAGWTVKLISNIDLEGNTWEPIGTSTNPFSGIFDGQGYTIKNYKIRGSEENSGLALFGFIEGTNNTDVATFTKDTPLSNFYNTSTYSVYLPSEDIFTCAIKNLNVANADVNTTADGWTAAVVAYVKNATVANVHLSDSTLTATCKVGGIAGYLPDNYCCFITNCSTANNVTVTASAENHCTGILSRVSGTASHAIIANCTNNATISCAGVNGAGIAGQAKGVLYYNDTNNGAVTSGTRAAGIATDCSGSVFIDCTNTGHIKANNTMSGSSASIAGIASYLASTGHNVIVNCQNSGTVEGTCAYSEYGAKIAGIIAGGVTASDVILNNANTGTLINNAEGGKVYDICNLSSVPYVVEPSDLAGLNTATATDNKYIKVTNSISLLDGDTVVVNGQEKLEFVNSPAYLTIDLTNSNENSFVIMVNNTTVTLVNGSGKVVTVSGKGNTVVVEAEQSIKSLRVSNEDAQVASSLDLAGTADIILLNGSGLVNAEVKAGAKAGRVCFGGTGTFVLTNRGTISHKTEGQYGAEHTIDTINSCNITIHNYGTIEAKKNSNNVCSYALLFYGGANVKFYAYEESMVIQELHSAMAISGGTTIDFYYQEGAGLNIYGNNYTYPQTFNYGDSNITVTKMN